MNRGIIFDLDGTLADSLPGIAEGVNRALETLGKQRLRRSATGTRMEPPPPN